MNAIYQQSMITLTYFPIPTLRSLSSISHVLLVIFYWLFGSVSHSQNIGQKLIQFGHLGGNAEVDSPIADLDDETSDNVRVDL